MPSLSQETIRLLDEIDYGDCIEIQYDSDDRKRLAIGQFDELAPAGDGEWCVWLIHRFVGIKLIDVVSIERVETANKR